MVDVLTNKQADGSRKLWPEHSWTFKFRSNALCLNFVASMAGPFSRPHGVERWTEPLLLEEWVAKAGLPSPESAVTTRQLAEARELREAIYRLATLEMSRERPDHADVELLNRWNRGRPYLPRLDLTARSQSLDTSLHFEELMSLVAGDAIDLFTSQHNNRIKECGSEKCPILFVDRSRAGNRRWCSERPCGFQASSRAYRQRAVTNRN